MIKIVKIKSLSVVLVILFVVSTATATLKTNLIGYWNFNDDAIASLVYDNSGSGIHGIYSDSQQRLQGIDGLAFNAAGSEYVVLGNQNDLKFGSATNFTVSMWFKSTSINNGTFITNKNWSSGNNIGWTLAPRSSTGSFWWNWRGADGSRIDYYPSSPSMTDGQWHMLTVTHDRAGDATFYFDGVKIHQIDISVSPGSIDSGLPTTIGADGVGGYVLGGDGAMDDVAIWNRVLTEVEVGLLYGGGQPASLTLAEPAAFVSETIRNKFGAFPCIYDYPNNPPEQRTQFYVLRGDFHMHTTRSDGHLTPYDRVVETWAYGYDVMAITDHRNYEAYREALPVAEHIGMVLVRGMETGLDAREHLVALNFADTYQTQDEHSWSALPGGSTVYYQDQWQSIVEAGAYMIYAHPHVGLQDEMLWGIQQGYLKGIEIKTDDSNSGWGTVFSHGTDWYPFAFDWALEHNLAVFATTDVHHTRGDTHLATTLVFAEEKSVEGVMEAVNAGRTVADFNGLYCGTEQHLEMLIHNLIEVYFVHPDTSSIVVKNSGPMNIEFNVEGITTESVELQPFGSVFVDIAGNQHSQISLKWNNLWISSTENLITIHSPSTLTEPIILQQPSDKVVGAFENASFSVDGVNIDYYSWYKEGEPEAILSGYDKDTLTIQNAELQDEGLYYCVVSNVAGEVQSNPARLWTKRLIGHYALNSNVENSSVITVGNPNATAVCEPQWVEGIDDDAMQIENKSSYLVLGEGEDFNFGDSVNFSVSLWVKVASFTNDGAFISNKDWRVGTNTGWVIGPRPATGSWQWNWKGELGSRLDYRPSSPALADNQWHMLTVTHDRAGNATFYFDGAKQSEIDISSSHGSIDFGFPTAIGIDGYGAAIGRYNFAYKGDGAIDDVRIYNYVLTDADVANLYIDFNPDESICLKQSASDLTGDCIVGFDDFLILVQGWLECNLIPDCY